MKAQEAIERIKVMLGLEVKKLQFETKAVLKDGTEVYSEGPIASGEGLFVVTPDGMVKAPQGTHETTEGLVVEVDDNGIITSVSEVEDVEGGYKKEEKMEDTPNEEEGNGEVKEEVADKIAETIVEALKPLMEEMGKMKEEMKNYKEKLEKFSKSPAGEPVISQKETQKPTSLFEKRLEILKGVQVQ